MCVSAVCAEMSRGAKFASSPLLDGGVFTPRMPEIDIGEAK